MNLLLVFCVILYFGSIDCIEFRLDYEYHDDVKGWMKLHRIPATWEDAHRTCFYEGAVLASPEDEDIWHALRKKATDMLKSPGLIFTGIHARFGKRQYYSVGGISLSQMPVNWAPGQPDNFKNNEECIAMFSDGNLADDNCSNTYPFICYKKKSRSTVMNQACGITDPEYTLDIRTSSCYKFHREPQNWQNSFEACSAEGGHLVVINSDKEVQLIKELFDKNPENEISGKFKKDRVHIGFRYFSELGVWQTILGQMLNKAGYAKWAPKDSNKTNENDAHCGAMIRSGFLDEENCKSELSFICEKNPNSLVSKNGGIPLSSINYSDACSLALADGTVITVECSDVHLIFETKSGKTRVSSCGTTDPAYVLDDRTGSCYKFHIQPTTWPDAFETCKNEEGHLVVINSETEKMVVHELFAPQHLMPARWRDGAHIGFRDFGFPGEISWLTIHGQTLEKAGHANWASGQPDNSGGNQRCGAIFRDNGLDDDDCDGKYAFVCEKNPTNLIARGTPLMEIPEGTSISEPGTAGYNKGCIMTLPNGIVAEVNCSHIPFLYKENIRKIAANPCGTKDSAYQLDVRTGSCYKFHREPKYWHRAFETCADEGGHLAIINSDIEVEAIKDVFNKNPADTLVARWVDGAHIGFKDFGFGGERRWLTIEGQSLKRAGSPAWDGVQPDNLGGNQHCGAVFRHGAMDDDDCDSIYSFICEKDPNSPVPK